MFKIHINDWPYKLLCQMLLQLRDAYISLLYRETTNQIKMLNIYDDKSCELHVYIEAKRDQGTIRSHLEDKFN
jgi:hypothetical protein